MGVKRKLKDTCGSKVRGICITYDGAVPEWSTIEDVDCVVVEETIEDLYEAVSELKEITNLGDISDDCIDYEEEVCKEVTSKEVLLKHKELIKKLLEVTGITDSEVTESTETKAPVDVSNLDTKCLADACGEQITSAEQLLQILIDKVCLLCDNVDTTTTTTGGQGTVTDPPTTDPNSPIL